MEGEKAFTMLGSPLDTILKIIWVKNEERKQKMDKYLNWEKYMTNWLIIYHMLSHCNYKVEANMTHWLDKINNSNFSITQEKASREEVVII